MNRIFTEEDIRKILDECSLKTGLSSEGIPVSISSRMEKTYGSFQFRIKDGNIEPLAFKFSLKLISGDFPEKTVEDTVKHEFAHYYANVINNRNCNHGPEFKKACRLLGIPEGVWFTGNHIMKEKAGYSLYCSECFREVGRRRRLDAAHDITRKYLSGCCHGKIKIKKIIY